MPRPIWQGNITFGLINIPVALYSAEKRVSIHFNLLDSRDHAHIRYERVNEITGEEVPWDQIVKAYEFKDGNYVILKEKELKKAEIENSQSVEIEDFIDQKSLDCLYFEKPYYLVPVKSGLKAYVLLRETLKKTKKVGIAKVVIRTKQYLAVVMPYDNSLLLNLLRFAQELKNPSEFDIPKQTISKYKISAKEIEMAERVVASMTAKWNPKKYHDEHRDKLMEWIKRKMKKEPITVPEKEEPKETAKIIDLMQLLKKSVKKKSTSKKSTIKRGKSSLSRTTRALDK